VRVRKLAVMVAISTIGFTGVALLASPAGAGVSTSSLCSALTNLHYTPSSNPTAAGGEANAKKLAKAFNNAAKKANGSFKASLKTMAQYFKALSTGNTAVIQNDAEAFGTASQNYATYLVSHCTPGVPGGISIP